MESADARPAGSLPHLRAFLAIVLGIVAADQVAKFLAVQFLAPAYLPRPVMGEWVRLTLVYNPGAAFGISFGPYSREIFTVLTIGALILLWRLYRETRAGDLPRLLAISLVTAGAVGNVVDRFRSGRGVVDFIDVGIRASRWPTFNVADMAISCGAVLLAIVLWREDVARHRTRTESRATDAQEAIFSTSGADAGGTAPGAGAAPADAPLHG